MDIQRRKKFTRAEDIKICLLLYKSLKNSDPDALSPCGLQIWHTLIEQGHLNTHTAQSIASHVRRHIFPKFKRLKRVLDDKVVSKLSRQYAVYISRSAPYGAVPYVSSSNNRAQGMENQPERVPCRPKDKTSEINAKLERMTLRSAEKDAKKGKSPVAGLAPQNDEISTNDENGPGKLTSFTSEQDPHRVAIFGLPVASVISLIAQNKGMFKDKDEVLDLVETVYLLDQMRLRYEVDPECIVDIVKNCPDLFSVEEAIKTNNLSNFS